MLARNRTFEFDPIFTQKFFTAPSMDKPIETLFPVAIPDSPNELKTFFNTIAGRRYHYQANRLIEQLESWAQQQGIATEGIQLFRFNHLEKHNESLTIRYELYHDGIPTLYVIVNTCLSNPRIALDSKKQIIRNLIEDIGLCGPGTVTHIGKAYLEFQSLFNMNSQIMLFRQQIAEQVARACTDELLVGQDIGDEIHYINRLLNECANTIGITPNNDAYSKLTKENNYRPAINNFIRQLSHELSLENIISLCIETIGLADLPNALARNYQKGIEAFENACDRFGQLPDNKKLQLTDAIFVNNNNEYFISWRSRYALRLTLFQRLQTEGYIDEKQLSRVKQTAFELTLANQVQAHIYRDRDIAFSYMVNEEGKLIPFIPYWVNLLCSNNPHRFGQLKSLMHFTDVALIQALLNGLAEYLQAPDFAELDENEKKEKLNTLIPCLPILLHDKACDIIQLKNYLDNNNVSDFFQLFYDLNAWARDETHKQAMMSNLLNPDTSHEPLRMFLEQMPDETITSYVTDIDELIPFIFQLQGHDDIILSLVKKCTALLKNHYDLRSLLHNIPENLRTPVIACLSDDKRQQLTANDQQIINDIASALPPNERDKIIALLDGFSAWLNQLKRCQTQRRAQCYLETTNAQMATLLKADFPHRLVEIYHVTNIHNINLFDYIDEKTICDNTNNIISIFTFWQLLKNEPDHWKSQFFSRFSLMLPAIVQNDALSEILQHDDGYQFLGCFGNDAFNKMIVTQDCLITLFTHRKNINDQRHLLANLQQTTLHNRITDINKIITLFHVTSPWLHKDLINKIGINWLMQLAKTSEDFVALLAVVSPYQHKALIENLQKELVDNIMHHHILDKLPKQTRDMLISVRAKQIYNDLQYSSITLN